MNALDSLSVTACRIIQPIVVAKDADTIKAYLAKQSAFDSPGMEFPHALRVLEEAFELMRKVPLNGKLSLFCL